MSRHRFDDLWPRNHIKTMAHFEEVNKETDGICQASSHDQRTQVTLGKRHAKIHIMMKNRFYLHKDWNDRNDKGVD